MIRLTPDLVFRKAVERYFRDAERRLERPEPPLALPRASVDLKRKVVTLKGSGGFLAAYTYTLTSQGYLRFRPDWPSHNLHAPDSDFASLM